MASLVMVIGGASSGKSSFAESLTTRQAEPRTYIATAQAFDAEMHAKIDAHKAARAGDNWTTVEAPMDVARAVTQAQGLILIDCATLWLSNLMLAQQDCHAATGALIDALAQKDVTIVTNEVGQGVIPAHAMGRKFQRIQGQFNIRLAAQADTVVQVIAGLPRVLKGAI